MTYLSVEVNTLIKQNGKEDISGRGNGMSQISGRGSEFLCETEKTSRWLDLKIYRIRGRSFK